jgi:glycosyltransferase involved in cell wall biosynthesis
MKISVVTVSYNSERHIQRCFDSVLAQTTPVFEHIVVDGLSEDGTGLIIANYLSQETKYRKVYISERDSGVYEAMNKGIKASQGDYIWFLNSDDRLGNSGVIARVDELIAENGATMVAGDTLIRDDTRVVRRYSATGARSRYFPQQPHPSLLVDLHFLRRHGIFFDESKKMLSDYKMQLEILKKQGTLAVHNETFTEMFVGGITNSTLLNKLHGWVEAYQVYREVFGKGAFMNTLLKVVTKIFQYERLRIWGGGSDA